MNIPFSVDIEPNWEGFLQCLRREGTPERVHFIELLIDDEVKDALVERYGLIDAVTPDDPHYLLEREWRVQRFLGQDFVRWGVDDVGIKIGKLATDDTAELARAGGREYYNEHKGPITTWDEFEAYPWPDPKRLTTTQLEWFEKNLPDDMCVVGSRAFAHFSEYLNWLMGYETLCYSLFDQRDLVEAISRKLLELYSVVVQRMLEFDRVKAIWGGDDMGYRGGTLIGPNDVRAFVLPGHKAMAGAAHDAGRPYLLHSCGNLRAIMDDLIDDVKIDAKHSFEDTIETVEQAKERYGDRIAVLGGIDVDFLCRRDEAAVRERTRATLEVCQPGGGYCLGTGNSVPNYMPLDNFLAMLDEGRKFGR